MTTPTLPAGLAAFWAANGPTIVAGSGTLLAVALAVLLIRFLRSGRKSVWISRLTAAVVLAWTAEGTWQFIHDRMHAPTVFAAVSFFVFEAMLATAVAQAEEHRTAKGVPGPAGRYVWVIAAAMGVTAALGAQSGYEVPFRLALPVLAIGQWWVTLTAERPTDTEEMLLERKRRAAEREATWAWTPRDVLVALGLMKPGRSTTTEAQREYQIRRMVVAADRIAAGGWGAKRARKRLRRLARSADADMVATVARQTRQAVEAERLMVPANGQTAATVAVTEAANDDDLTGQPGGHDSGQTAASLTATTPATFAATRRPGKPANTKARVLAMVRRDPATTAATVAAKFDIPERTARRHVKAARDALGLTN